MTSWCIGHYATTASHTFREVPGIQPSTEVPWLLTILYYPALALCVDPCTRLPERGVLTPRGPDRTRTDSRLLAKQVHFQLCYRPVGMVGFEPTIVSI